MKDLGGFSCSASASLLGNLLGIQHRIVPGRLQCFASAGAALAHVVPGCLANLQHTMF